MAEHVLKNTQATLEMVFSAGYADGAVTVTVKNAAGATVVSGAATKDLTTPGRYTYALAPQADVASLTATWSGAWGGVTQSIAADVEVVGGLLFTIAELRDFDDAKLASTTEYTAALIAEKRAEITDFFDRVCGVSFIPRYSRDVFEGDGSDSLELLHMRVTKILAVSVNGTALSAGDIAALDVYESGKLVRSVGWWPRSSSPRRNIVVEYEHGWAVPPATIAKAAKILARYELISSDIGDRTISIATELGHVRLSVPGEKYPTGIPVVDAALCQYDARGPVV